PQQCYYSIRPNPDDLVEAVVLESQALFHDTQARESNCPCDHAPQQCYYSIRPNPDDLVEAVVLESQALFHDTQARESNCPCDHA
ncbi:unnamed protein product, partial [Adineta ricciae]